MNPYYLFARRRVMEKVVRGIIADGAGVPPGEVATVTTKNQQGTIVGQGTLRWQHAPS